MKRFTIKNGFTLAEVLVTLMIIGVIASMTIPALKKNSEVRELTAGCQKAYSTLSQAIALAEQDNAPSKRWSMLDADTDDTWSKIEPYLNITKVCTPANGLADCWTRGKITSLKRNEAASGFAENRGYGSPTTSFKLADGTNYTFDLNPGGYYLFYADVNGDKKPNTVGIDIFGFIDNRDGKGLVPMGTGISGNGDCVTDGAGTQCAAKVLREGTISYF